MPVEILCNALKLDLELKKYRNKNKEIKIVGIDATSAPGNKTLQLGELCDKVYAFERDPKRVKTLEMRVRKADLLQRITCMNSDFIEHPNPLEDETVEKLKFIVCDPSCSGSGMRLH